MYFADVRRFNRLVWISWWYQLKILTRYPLTLFGSLLHYIWGLGFRILFWSIVVRHSNLSSTPLSEIISYFFIAEFLYAFFLCDAQMSSVSTKHIKTGQLNYLLSRPGCPLVQLYAKTMPGYVMGQIWSVVLLIIGIVMSQGLFAHMTLTRAAIIGVALVNAFILNLSFNIFFSTLTFYTTEGKSLRNVLLHVLRVFRGEWVPLVLLSAPVVKVLEVLPSASTYYLPVRLLQGVEVPSRLVMLGTLWALPIFYLSLRFWKRGLRSYEAVGI